MTATTPFLTNEDMLGPLASRYVDVESLTVWSPGVQWNGFQAAAGTCRHLAKTTSCGEVIGRKELFRQLHMNLRRLPVNVAMQKPLDR